MSTPALARAYVPVQLAERTREDGQPALFDGAALLADLVDFSGLTQSLSDSGGADGAEEVGRALNQALEPVIRAVTDHGGEIVKFSGDGLLCVFVSSTQPLEGAQRAAREIARVRGHKGVGAFRVAVASGPVLLLCLGGYRGRFELVAGGPAVLEVQRRVLQAEPGTSGVVSNLARSPAKDGVDASRRIDPGAFLPPTVRERIAQNRAEWLREFRTLTIVFLAVDCGDAGASMAAPARLIQALVDDGGGELLRFSLDDATLVTEVAFGLSLQGRHTGAMEALQVAERAARVVSGARAGVASGRVFLGPVGSAQRQQWTSLGSTVNLAARLAHRAAVGQVLLDESTWVAHEERLVGAPARATLKGLGERGYWHLQDIRHEAVAPDQPCVGRGTEMAALVAHLDAAAQPTRPIVVRGEAGLGKSRLCRWLAAELAQRGIDVWPASATAVGRDKPYAAIADVLRTLCGIPSSVAPVEAALRKAAARTPGGAERAPLLADALGLALSDTSDTRWLAGRERADNIRETLVALVLEAERGKRCALVVDDAHWLDSASWALLHRLCIDCRELRLILFSRPLPEPSPLPLRAILASDALLIDLAALSAPDITAVVEQRLGVRSVPHEVATWVTEQARGNPFFARELAAMLLAVSSMRVRDGVIEQSPPPDELAALPSVDTIEVALEQRIDGLGVADAATLKVASVIGASFTIEDLDDLVDAGARKEMNRVLGRLVAADMAVVSGPGQFAFRHRYTQETAYRMLTVAQRRDLHRKMALRLERTLADRADESAHELAHHWFTANDRPKALQWLERAGAQALRTGADKEARTHFRRALTIADLQYAGHRATLHRQLARAAFGLGEVRRVAYNASKAVKLVAHPLPRSAPGWALLSLASTCARLTGLRGAGRLRERAPSDLLEGARAAGLLAESAYFLNSPEKMLGAALLAVRLAESAGDAAPVAVAYGMLGVVAGMARMHGLALRYLKRARALAEAADDAYQLAVAWFYAGLYQGCIGAWGASSEAALQALGITERLGAHMQSGFEYTLLASNALYTSEYAHARSWMDTVRARAERASNVQQLGWSANVVSVADLHQGRYEQAIAGAERARRIFLAERDGISLIIAEGVQCAALARTGHTDDALAAARAALLHGRGARPTSWGQLEGYAGPCEAFARAMVLQPSRSREIGGEARTALAGLRRFAWMFPFGAARYHWILAMHAQAAGRQPAALRSLRTAIAVARTYGMPFEELQASRLVEPMTSKAERGPLHERLATLEALMATSAPVQGASQAA